MKWCGLAEAEKSKREEVKRYGRQIKDFRKQFGK